MTPMTEPQDVLAPKPLRPTTNAGRMMLAAGLTFHSGRRLADFPETIIAVEQEAAERAALVRTPETLDSDAFRDQHERAIRAHILEGPEDHRCDDLCSAAIIDRLVGKHPVNEYPPLASPAPDPGWLDVSERAGVSLWPERIEARQVVTADRDVIVIIGPLPRADALRATPVADTAGMPPEHRPVLGKVPRADLQRIECACGWLWDDRDPLDDPEGMDFMRHLAALAASPAPDPGAGLRATVAELLDVMHGAFSLGTGPCSCEVHVRARAALAPSAEPPETAG